MAIATEGPELATAGENDFIDMDLRIDASTAEDLQNLAALNNTDVNSLVVKALEDYLKPTEDKDRLTPDDIANAIVKVDYHAIPDTSILICVITLKNGAKVVGKNYGSINSSNYSLELARDMAYKEAVEKVWELEGYLLRQRLYEKEQQK